MGVEKLDELLKRMPDIAKAVNAFASETVQQQAYRSLLAAFGESVRAEDDPEREGEETDDQSLATPPRRAQRVAKNKAAPLDNDNKPAKRRPVSAPSINKALNLRPSGEASLKDFATEKAPGDNTDRSMVAVHYLTHTLGSSTVSSDDIFTCYREMGWKLPADFRNHLQVIASRKGWLDTSDMDAISLTPSGINRVEQDLPKPTK